jgi:DNA-binding PadR family transcriptional regulator
VRDRTGRHHHEDDDLFRHEYGRRPHRERGGRGRAGGPRDRARRGEARYLLLDALRDGPKHGYEIIRALEERSSGQYAPSPGTVYPTLQYLEDLGLVRAEQEAERRVYHLTETGRAELNAHAEEVDSFWARLRGKGASPASRTELGFLQDELDHLMRTVWGGLQALLGRDDDAAIRRVRQSVEQCREEVRRIIAGDTPGAV